ncbi:hypothetical protein SAMN02745751_03450 [Dethiosulfatibacter aminovorans DSM 17477]|uniref:Uncharacterized protein n=1 Tax=Dethiosulfatibacter aminovorans DSM 17477 TaxID=1121476 RepID=A0A1M6MEF3_9FIRM|nr:ABC-three component system middle component 1 [Dethiosulfatibacter aminovorans]SHJ81845.1 hypothetical protein SAMN02745751_03450 [Dethiosulfatibacter aminovorans DSM 17477]
MIEVIEQILTQYSYVEHLVDLPSGLKFFKHNNISIASYFIITVIDCRSFEEDEDEMKIALEKLEQEYIGVANQDYSIKSRIQSSFNNNREASQIDKNTSAIYLLLMQDTRKIDQFRNLVFSIEESPNYFKRYVLPYTIEQQDNLKSNLSEFSGREINDVLSNLVNNETEYYKLLEGRNFGSEYELIIKLFSKLPFLQYEFKPESAPISLDEDISRKIEVDLEKYHELISDKSFKIEDIYSVEDNEIDKNIIEDELGKLLGGNQ